MGGHAKRGTAASDGIRWSAMKETTMFHPAVRVLILLLAVLLAGCVAYAPPPPPPARYAYVPGYWVAGPYGYHWVPGHYRVVY